MRQPTGLANAGKKLWRQMRDALPEGWVFDERELAILERACRQADDLALLEAAIRREGVTATGSQGQRVLSPLVPEARQARLSISRLLGELALPVESEAKPLTAAGRRAKRAADARWAERGASVRG